MRSTHLGRFFDVDFFLHWTLPLFLAAVLLPQWLGGAPAAAVFDQALLITAVFACVALHELGHALAARQFGIATRDVILTPIGGIARLEGMPEAPLQELLVAVAGPLVNVGIACFLAGAVLLGEGAAGLVDDSFSARLAWINVGLAVFNLLPALPMDGGRVLRSLLALAMPRTTATRIAAGFARGLAVAAGVAILGWWMFQGGAAPLPVVPLLIAGFVYFAAGAELRQVEQRAGVVPARRELGQGATLRELLGPAGPTVGPYDSLLARSPALLASGADAFLVVDGERVVGVILREDVLERVRRGGDAMIRELLLPRVPVAGADVSPADAAREMAANNVPAVLVADRGGLLGLLTRRAVFAWLQRTSGVVGI